MEHSTEAEQAVLGAMICKNDVITDVLDRLTVNDFYEQRNKVMFSAIKKLAADRKPADLVTITQALNESGDLERCGGVMYVTSIANAVPSASNVGAYVDIVVDRSKRRKLMETTSMIQSRLKEEDDIDLVLDDAQGEITKTILRNCNDDIQTTPEMIMEYVDWMNNRRAMGDETGTMSGFKDLDKMTHGFQEGELDILAARPAMGKTALALNIASNACDKGKSVLMFSLEMSKEQLLSRLVAVNKKIDSNTVMNPSEMTDNQYNEFLQFSNEVYSKWKLRIDDRAAITPTELANKARRIKARDGLDMIIVDYLQLMDGTRGGKASESRVQEISYITRELKKTAKDLEVPVIALSQLSRSVEQRQDKRPMLSDLRESGSIEQDADIVMFLYRENYYYPECGHNVTELIMSKHRNGPIGTVNLVFMEQATRFEPCTMTR